MVKNSGGGNKSKRGARKNMGGNRVSANLRTIECEGELYAVVIKLLGGNMFHAQCVDGELRLGHIRGKFAGRRKRDNEISAGTWVLVGEREWTMQLSKDGGTPAKKVKLAECDLLEVYADLDKERLRGLPDVTWSNLDINDGSTKRQDLDDIVRFSTESNVEMEQFLDDIQTGKSKSISTIGPINKGPDMDIDFDDI